MKHAMAVEHHVSLLHNTQHKEKPIRFGLTCMRVQYAARLQEHLRLPHAYPHVRVGEAHAAAASHDLQMLLMLLLSTLSHSLSLSLSRTIIGKKRWYQENCLCCCCSDNCAAAISTLRVYR
jgi:hypothetical protein